MSTLDTAWQTFEQNDVRPIELLCLRWERLDNDRFVSLQRAATEGKPDQRKKAAKELLAMIGHLPTPELFDGVLSSVAMDLKDHEQVIASKAQALAVTPRWHPEVASRVVGNTGWALQEMGKLDEALVWFERALSFDPVNPFALVSMAEIWATQGDKARAASVRRYLASVGCPGDHCEALDKLIGRVEKKGDVYEPSLEILRRSSARDWGRVVAACLADEQTPIERRLRAIALGAAMRGELGMAQLYVAEALNGEDGQGAQLDPLQRSWLVAIQRLLEGAPTEPADIESRGQAFDAIVASGNLGELRRFLCDPVAPLRALAAENLADADGRAYLEEIAAIEAKEGLSAGASSASFALHRLAVKAAGKRAPIVIPPDYRLTSVAKLTKHEGVVMWATFPGVITPDGGAWFDDALQKASADLATEEPQAQLFANNNGQTLEIIVRDVKKPELVAKAFGTRFSAEGTPLREIVIGRYELPDGKKRQLFHPTKDANAPEREVARKSRWKAAFDPKSAPPLSEPEDGPSMMMIQSPQGYLPEVRLPPMRFDDVRVVYGLENVDDRASNARDEAFDTAMREALAEAFRGVPPTWFNKKGETCGPSDPIACHGRNGHAIALSGLRPEFVVHHPTNFRFREWELLSAFRAVIAKLELAPVIHWQRDSGTWIVNMWERD